MQTHVFGTPDCSTNDKHCGMKERQSIWHVYKLTKIILVKPNQYSPNAYLHLLLSEQSHTWYSLYVWTVGCGNAYAVRDTWILFLSLSLSLFLLSHHPYRLICIAAAFSMEQTLFGPAVQSSKILLAIPLTTAIHPSTTTTTTNLLSRYHLMAWSSKHPLEPWKITLSIYSRITCNKSGFWFLLLPRALTWFSYIFASCQNLHFVTRYTPL